MGMLLQSVTNDPSNRDSSVQRVTRVCGCLFHGCTVVVIFSRHISIGDIVDPISTYESLSLWVNNDDYLCQSEDEIDPVERQGMEVCTAGHC